MHIVGIADLNPEQAKVNCLRTGWSEEQLAASNLSDAQSSGKTCILEDSDALIRHDGLEVLIEATGDPAAGVAHCLNAIENGRHIVMVNVEADVVAGPLLAQKAKDTGVCYSLAYGDQPSLVCGRFGVSPFATNGTG
jgi:predicted homoserine dehydrogenase-like protein